MKLAPLPQLLLFVGLSIPHDTSALITSRSFVVLLNPSLGSYERYKTRTRISALPTVNDVSNDDFMKQLGHASQLIPLLHEGDLKELSDSAALLEILSRQLSHSDGIRGFFAVYLTSPQSMTTEEVPAVLAEAVRAADSKIIVPLACMNVIMPTAMSSIHSDAELISSAEQTANNGMKILRLLKGYDEVVNNCNAILSVCLSMGGDCPEGGIMKDLTEYWEKFFVSQEYEEQQKKVIARAIVEFCKA